MDSATQSSIHPLLFVSFLIWQQWEGLIKYHKTPPLLLRSHQQADMPSSDSLAVTGNSNEQAKLITVKTDVYDLRINTPGAVLSMRLIC